MRNSFGLLASLALLLAACGGTAASASSAPPSGGAGSARAKASTAASMVKLVAGHSNPIPESMALYVAKDAGVFEKHGLDVDVRLIAGGSTAMAAVVSGETPFSHLGGSEALSSAAGGADILVLAITSPVQSFVLDVANDIKSPADLKGKRLGISSIGGSADIALHVALKRLGLDPDKDVNITATGSTANRRAALLSGAIQGAMELPQDAIAVEANGFHRMLDLAAEHVPATGQGIIAQRAYVNAHRDVTQRYVDSIVEAAALARKERQKAIDIIVRNIKADDVDAVAKAYDLYQQNTYTPTPFPRPELWTDAIEVLGAKNEKLRTFDVKTMVDPSFVQSAVDRGLNK